MLLVDIEYLVNDGKAWMCLHELIHRWEGDIKDPNEYLHNALTRKIQWYLAIAPRMLPDGTFETQEQAKERAGKEFVEIDMFDGLTDEKVNNFRKNYHADGRKRVSLDDYDYWDALRTETERLFELTAWKGGLT